MSRRMLVNFFAGLLVLALGLPAVATPRVAKDGKTTIKATLSLPDSVTIGGKQLKPGDYQVAADGTRVTITQYGKVVAEANAQFVDGTDKQKANAVVLDGNQVKEIRFSGKSRYVVIQ